MGACKYVCTCICMYTYMYTHVCVCVFTFVCMDAACVCTVYQYLVKGSCRKQKIRGSTLARLQQSEQASGQKKTHLHFHPHAWEDCHRQQRHCRCGGMHLRTYIYIPNTLTRRIDIWDLAVYMHTRAQKRAHTRIHALGSELTRTHSQS